MKRIYRELATNFRDIASLVEGKTRLETVHTHTHELSVRFSSLLNRLPITDHENRGKHSSFVRWFTLFVVERSLTGHAPHENSRRLARTNCASNSSSSSFVQTPVALACTCSRNMTWPPVIRRFFSRPVHANGRFSLPAIALYARVMQPPRALAHTPSLSHPLSRVSS